MTEDGPPLLGRLALSIAHTHYEGIHQGDEGSDAITTHPVSKVNQTNPSEQCGMRQGSQTDFMSLTVTAPEAALRASSKRGQ